MEGFCVGAMVSAEDLGAPPCTVPSRVAVVGSTTSARSTAKKEWWSCPRLVVRKGMVVLSSLLNSARSTAKEEWWSCPRLVVRKGMVVLSSLLNSARSILSTQ